MMKSGGPRTVH